TRRERMIADSRAEDEAFMVVMPGKVKSRRCHAYRGNRHERETALPGADHPATHIGRGGENCRRRRALMARPEFDPEVSKPTLCDTSRLRVRAARFIAFR